VRLTPNVSWYEAILSAAPLAGLYVWKMIWPVHLIAYYPFHKSATLLDARVWTGTLALALCALAFVVLWKRHHLVSFGFVWFFLNIAPVLNSRWLGPNVFTERYLYLPSVGLCWVAAWGILKLWKGGAREPQGRPAFPRRRWAGVVLGALLGVISVLAIIRIVTRNRDWRDDETYYQVTLAQVPEAEGLRLNLGAAYWDHMHPDLAEREWLQALKAAPHSATLLNDLGLVAVRKKQYDQAIAYFDAAMHERPNYTDAHLNLGRAYEALGRSGEAQMQLQAAVALAPLDIQARNELGQYYFAAGRLAEAEEQFRASTASIANTGAYDALGDIAVREGRPDAASQAYRQAIALDAFDYHAHFGWGAILAAQGRTAEAAAEYRAGLSVDPNNQEAQAALKRLSVNSHR